MDIFERKLLKLADDRRIFAGKLTESDRSL